MQLPKSNGLPVNLLAACFNSTSATYKYYWLLSILQSVENGSLKIPKRELFARMISNAWFTVNYFKVSFGKQDLIQDVVRVINEVENISIDEKQESVFQKLLNTTNSKTEKLLWHFNKNVPHWFLSTWFPKNGNETNSVREKRIYNASKSYSENCLYSLHDEFIEINTEWETYLTSNAGILKDFCYWNLCLYLQVKNPNVPDISGKLIKPAFRNSLKKQRNQFWDIIFKELETIDCIYTGEKLSIENYAVEHFIPHAFVSHDLIWNLIPANKSFNSSKSDKLPPLDKYFNSFFALQKKAVEIMSSQAQPSKLLEDYLTVFPDINTSFTKEKYRDIIQPLITIASNNGFEFMK